MLWVTRSKPHVDRCASAWLIKRFIDNEASFEFISEEEPIPESAIAFTLPRAQIKPIEGRKTTYDTLIEKYRVEDPTAIRIGEVVHDYEINAGENPKRTKLKETLGLCYVLRSLEKTSKTDNETIERALIVLDAFYASLKETMQLSSP